MLECKNCKQPIELSKHFAVTICPYCGSTVKLVNGEMIVVYHCSPELHKEYRDLIKGCTIKTT